MSVVCVIDPGHGGASTGVVRGNEGVDRLVEKDLVLELGLILANRLGHLPGVVSALTRDEDQDLGLSEAARVARELGADLALCLHVNSYTDPHRRGLLAFYWPGQTEARWVAETIAQHAPLALRGVAPRPRAATQPEWPGVCNVLAPFVGKGICAVLVECGFATNSADRAFLLSAPGKQAIANAIEAGVIEFWRARSVKHAA